ICEIAKSVDVFPLPQGSSSGFGKHFAAGAGDEGGDDAGRGLFAQELHGAIGAERVGAAGVERVDLIHVVAVDAAAAAVPNGAVRAEAADADGGVVVGPGGVEGPADLARAVRLNRLALGINLVAAGVLADDHGVRGAVRDLLQLDAAGDQALRRHLSA